MIPIDLGCYSLPSFTELCEYHQPIILIVGLRDFMADSDNAETKPPRPQPRIAQALARTLLGPAPTTDTPLIAHTPLGKPYLPHFPELEISISHSDDYLAMAFSSQGALGVDIESIQPVAQWERISRMAMCDDERALLLHATTDAARAQQFLELWCLKEASVKAAGTGFRCSPKKLQFQQSAPHRYHLHHHNGHLNGLEQEWTFHVSDLSLPKPHVLALAQKIRQPLQPTVFLVPAENLQLITWMSSAIHPTALVISSS